MDKGAIPRVTQELYFKCDPSGNKKLNKELTLKEFNKKLEDIENEPDDDRVSEEEGNELVCDMGCNGSPASELIDSGDMSYMALCDGCRDWSEFYWIK